MDPLTQELLQRSMGGAPQGAPGPPQGGVPQVPPNPMPRVPQQMKRFNNAQQLQDAYRNGWQPNPMLLRAQMS